MVFGTTFSSQNLISETNKGKLILKIDEGFYQFIKDPSNYGEINFDGSQNIKIYPGLEITDICAIDLFIANRSSNMFSNKNGNCLERDLSDIDFISYTCLSENTIYDISLDNSFVEITIEYKPNKLNKLNEIITNDASVNRNSSKLKFFNSPKIFNNALKNDYSKHLITPEQNDEYNIPGRDFSGHFNNLIYYNLSSIGDGDISTSLYIDDTSAEILTPVQLLNYKLLEIQEDKSKNVFFNTKNWGNYTHPLSGFHLGALAYNNLLYNDLSYNSNVFYNNSGNYFDEQTYRKLTIPHMANKYVKRINDICLNSDSSLVYNSEFNEEKLGEEVSYEDKNLLFNIDNEWQKICQINIDDISFVRTSDRVDFSGLKNMYTTISNQFFNIFNTNNQVTELIQSINLGDTDISCIKTKLGLSEDSIGRECEIKIEYSYKKSNDSKKKIFFFKGYDLSTCFGFFNSEHHRNLYTDTKIEISNGEYDVSYVYRYSGDVLSEPGLISAVNTDEISSSDNIIYELSGGKINYKKKYGYTIGDFDSKRFIDKNLYYTSDTTSSNPLWSFYSDNVRFTYPFTAWEAPFNIFNCILWKKVLDTSNQDVSHLLIKDILDPTYQKYLNFIDKNFFSFKEWKNLKNTDLSSSNSFNPTPKLYYIGNGYDKASGSNFNKYFHNMLYNTKLHNLTIDEIFNLKAFHGRRLKAAINISQRYEAATRDNMPIDGQSTYGYKNLIHSNEGIFYSLKDFLHDIAYNGFGNPPHIINSGDINVNRFISGAIPLLFQYISFIASRKYSASLVATQNPRDFPFFILGYGSNHTITQKTNSDKKYVLYVADNNTLLDNVTEENLKVYARKARQDINTKKLLDIKEFDKIPLFLYKDPFVNNHHQFEITSETIPTIYPALTCDVSSIVSYPYNVTTLASFNTQHINLVDGTFIYPPGLSDIVISSDNLFAFVTDNGVMRHTYTNTNHRTGGNIYKINLSSGDKTTILEEQSDDDKDDRPWGVAITPDGLTLLVTSTNTSLGNGEIKIIDIETSTVKERISGFNRPRGIAITPDGKTVLIVEEGAHRIRKLDIRTNFVTTLAGATGQVSGFVDDTGVNAKFRQPNDVAITPDGKTALIVDSQNHRIRKIDIATGAVTTLAGNSISGFHDDIGTNAKFNFPTGIAISPDGKTAFINDNNNKKIRKIDIASQNVTTITTIIENEDVNFEPYNIAISPDGWTILAIDETNKIVHKITNISSRRNFYNKKNLEEIYLTVDFTNSTNNLNNRFLSNFKTQLNKNNELLYFAQQNKINPPIKFKIRNSNYDDFPYYINNIDNIDNTYSIVNGQYSTIINDLFLYNLPKWQYRPIYEKINTNILSILNCNNNPDFSTNFGNKHFENLLAINNNKLPKLNEEKYTYKLIDYFDNSIYNLNKIYEYDTIDLSSYSYFADISLNVDDTKINVLEAFNDICTNYYDMSLINYMNNNNSKKRDNFPLYQNINIKIAADNYQTNIDYKLDLQLWDVSNMFIDLSNKYQIDFSNINCKGLNIFNETNNISINNDWHYICSDKLLRSRNFNFTSINSIIDLSFSINITDLSDSNLSMTNLNYLDFSYNLYNSSTNSIISNNSISNRFVLNFNYLTSRDNLSLIHI